MLELSSGLGGLFELMILWFNRFSFNLMLCVGTLAVPGLQPKLILTNTLFAIIKTKNIGTTN